MSTDPFAAYAVPVATTTPPKMRSATAEATTSEAEAMYAAQKAKADAAKAQADAEKAAAEAEVARAGVPTAVQEGQMKLTPGQQKVDERFAPDYADWRANGEFEGVTSQLNQLESALTKLQSGQQLSGAVVGRLPKFVQQMLYGDEPKNVQDAVGKVTVGTLRQILGAQFTENEGARIAAMSYDPTLDEASNIGRILSTVRELRARAMAKQASADYFAQHGTLAGYEGPNAAAPGDWDTGTIRSVEKNFEDTYGTAPKENVWEAETREGPTTKTTGGAGETYVSAEAKRQAAAIEKAWREGASPDEINAMAQSFGLGPYDPEILKAAEAERAKGRTGRPVRFLPYESERPLGEQIMGAAADNPVAGPVMSFAANTAPTAALDEAAALFGGDPEKTRLGLEYLQTRYPGAAMAGNIAGNVGYSLAGAGGLERLGLSALPATIGAETMMGGLRGGFGARENERLAGTLIGGGEGMLYGAAPAALSRVANPATPAAVRQMREADVPMSVGQTLGVPGAEASLATILPGGGDIARAAQRRAFREFPTAYVNQAASHIDETIPAGLTPTQRMGTAQERFNEAYDEAKGNLQVRMDPDLRTEIFDFRDRLGNGVDFSEETARRLGTLLDQQVVRRVGTRPSGETYKSLDSFLGKRRAAFAKQGNNEMVEGVDEMLRMIRDNARRHSAPEAVAAMDAVDTGYSHLIRAEEAAKRAGTAPGDFTPKQLLSAVQKGDLTARNRAFARGEARGQDFAQSGVEALGEVPPPVSGLERAAGYTVGTTVALPFNIALGLANAPGVRPALNTLIAGTRPEWMQTAGRAVAENPARLSGPLSTFPLFGDRAEAPPADINDLLAGYGVQPMQPGDLQVGPELTDMQRKYAAQAAAQSEPLTISAGSAAAEAPAGEVIDKATGRAVAFNPETKRWFYTDTGEDAEAPAAFAGGGLAHNGLAYALGR